MKKNENTAAADILHDLDRMTGLAGKEWSVAFAKRLGLSAAEIEKYMAKPPRDEKNGRG